MIPSPSYAIKLPEKTKSVIRRRNRNTRSRMITKSPEQRVVKTKSERTKEPGHRKTVLDLTYTKE